MDEQLPDDFLDIDKYLADCGTTTVRASLGNPSFCLLAEVPAEALSREVAKILHFLSENRIDVYMEGITDAEAYRFLTTDLMAAEIEHPRLPGEWRTGYIYSEFRSDEEEEENSEL
jgi:hypothetical protein